MTAPAFDRRRSQASHHSQLPRHVHLEVAGRAISHNRIVLYPLHWESPFHGLDRWEGARRPCVRIVLPRLARTEAYVLRCRC